MLLSRKIEQDPYACRLVRNNKFPPGNKTRNCCMNLLYKYKVEMKHVNKINETRRRHGNSPHPRLSRVLKAR